MGPWALRHLCAGGEQQLRLREGRTGSLGGVDSEGWLVKANISIEALKKIQLDGSVNANGCYNRKNIQETSSSLQN